MMRAMRQNILVDVSVLLQIVTDSSAQEHILIYYSGDWWSGFPSLGGQDSCHPVTSVAGLAEHWKLQRRNAIAVDRRHFVDASNLTGLSVADLQEAQSVTEDTIASLDLESDLVFHQISLVTSRIAELTDLDQRLDQLACTKPIDGLPEQLQFEGVQGINTTSKPPADAGNV
jgi:hypothetical protein